MKTQPDARVAMAVAWALGALACGGSASLTPPTPLPIEAADSVAQAKAPSLLGSWQLVSLAPAGQEPLNVAEPSLFTADFTADGRTALRADCNRCSAAYEATNNRLAIGLMACTRAYCASAPLDTTFAALVGQATSWKSVDGGLELRSEAGVLGFQKRTVAR